MFYRIEINLGHYRVLYSAAMKGGRSKAKRSAAAIDELLENDDEESTRTNNGTDEGEIDNRKALTKTKQVLKRCRCWATKWGRG